MSSDHLDAGIGDKKGKPSILAASKSYRIVKLVTHLAFSKSSFVIAEAETKRSHGKGDMILSVLSWYTKDGALSIDEKSH